jgi:hypothetical protein
MMQDQANDKKEAIMEQVARENEGESSSEEAEEGEVNEIKADIDTQE